MFFLSESRDLKFLHVLHLHVFQKTHQGGKHIGGGGSPYMYPSMEGNMSSFGGIRDSNQRIVTQRKPKLIARVWHKIIILLIVQRRSKTMPAMAPAQSLFSTRNIVASCNAVPRGPEVISHTTPYLLERILVTVCEWILFLFSFVIDLPICSIDRSAI